MANLCLKLENHHHAGNPKIMMNISCPLFQIDWLCVQALVVVPVSVPMPWVPASVDAFVVCSNSQMDLHLMCSSFFQMVHMASGTVSGATYTLFCYCCCSKGLTIINNDLNWTIERIENERIKKGRAQKSPCVAYFWTIERMEHMSFLLQYFSSTPGCDACDRAENKCNLFHSLCAAKFSRCIVGKKGFSVFRSCKCCPNSSS